MEILLPGNRVIRGEFGIVRVLRVEDEVFSVNMTMEPKEVAQARAQLDQLLRGLAAPASHYERLNRWYEAGPRSEEGEILIINLLESQTPPFVGLSADWVWNGDTKKNWVVSVDFDWLTPLPGVAPSSP